MKEYNLTDLADELCGNHNATHAEILAILEDAFLVKIPNRLKVGDATFRGFGRFRAKKYIFQNPGTPEDSTDRVVMKKVKFKSFNLLDLKVADVEDRTEKFDLKQG